ncbi:hypothetical protein, partial [Adonisia turfae]
MSNEVAISLISGSFGLAPMIIQALSAWKRQEKQDFQKNPDLSIVKLSRETYDRETIQPIIRAFKLIKIIPILMISYHAFLLARIFNDKNLHFS